ncbi:hypothetical protein STEG23_026097 [Scotinomys teguina]
MRITKSENGSIGPCRILFQKATNDKKQFLRLPASENSNQKVLETETQGINTMQVADTLMSTNLLLKESHGKRWFQIHEEREPHLKNCYCQIGLWVQEVPVSE